MAHTPTSTCHLSVEGMTCSSCTKAIVSALSDVKGVTNVIVSLETASASISHDQAAIQPEKIREVIEDCGFEVRIVETVTNHQSTYDIDGMVCESCVKSIAAALDDEAGVVECHVSLANKSALVVFDPGRVDSDRIRNVIEDAGFEAKESSIVGDVKRSAEALNDHSDSMVTVPVRAATKRVRFADVSLSEIDADDCPREAESLELTVQLSLDDVHMALSTVLLFVRLLACPVPLV